MNADLADLADLMRLYRDECGLGGLGGLSRLNATFFGMNADLVEVMGSNATLVGVIRLKADNADFAD